MLEKMDDDNSAKQPFGSKPLLLLLPIHVRKQIYLYCGLIRPCPIDLNIESVRKRWAADDRATRDLSTYYRKHHCQYDLMRRTTYYDGTIAFDTDLPPGLECFCPSLPHQLLRVCRAMHVEIETVLYGMNQFKASRHLPGDNLKVLGTLSPRVWSLLSSLHISLSEIPPYTMSLRTYQYDTINVQGLVGHLSLQKWVAVCKDILSQASPYHLKLSLSCNATDIETAQKLVAPLDGLPPLNELAVCLAVDPKQRGILEVAKDTIWRSRQKATQKEPNSTTSSSSSISWTSLPREIRLDILSRTDLVDYFFLSIPRYSYCGTARRHGFEIVAGKLQPRGTRCCYDCTPTLSTCTCTHMHAALSTSCTCTTLPTALFYVSKNMNADATVTFFSRNRFILSGDFRENTSLIRALSARNDAVLKSIRMLDLEISWEQLYSMLDPNSSMANDWAELVACMASSLHLPKLWLSIDAGQCRDELDVFDLHGHHDYSWMHKVYSALFDPLCVHLRGHRPPEKFHVFLCWWTEEEGRVEKAVMGEEYESVAEGKVPWRVRDPRYPHSAKMSRKCARYGTNRP